MHPITMKLMLDPNKHDCLKRLCAKQTRPRCQVHKNQAREAQTYEPGIVALFASYGGSKHGCDIKSHCLPPINNKVNINLGRAIQNRQHSRLPANPRQSGSAGDHPHETSRAGRCAMTKLKITHQDGCMLARFIITRRRRV
jgi:hypothetical protein